MDLVRQRRSIRKYKPDPVDEDDLKYVLEAARLAPSWDNRQCWNFIIVKGQRLREELASAARRKWVADAPVVLVACADPSRSAKKDGKEYYLVDMGVCVEHLILAATERGLGTCWVGDFKEKQVKKALDIPKNIKVAALIPLGKPDEIPSQEERKSFESITSSEKY